VNESKPSATIAGAGKISGGTYERISISGAGKVEGDVTAEEIRISGAGKIDGRVEAKEVEASGSIVVTKDLVADEMKVSGSGRIEGHARVKELKCSGSLHAGRLSCDYIKVSGRLRVTGDVESELFKASGGFEIDGLLSADKVEIDLGGRCQAREIGGGKISVTRGGWKDRGLLLDGIVRLFVGAGSAELRTSQIEGDEIVLEETIADVVRGKTIEIGPGCQIGRVEYTESLTVHPSARVGDQAKV